MILSMAKQNKEQDFNKMYENVYTVYRQALEFKEDAVGPRVSMLKFLDAGQPGLAQRARQSMSQARQEYASDFLLPAYASSETDVYGDKIYTINHDARNYDFTVHNDTTVTINSNSDIHNNKPLYFTDLLKFPIFTLKIFVKNEQSESILEISKTIYDEEKRKFIIVEENEENKIHEHHFTVLDLFPEIKKQKIKDVMEEVNQVMQDYRSLMNNLAIKNHQRKSKKEKKPTSCTGGCNII